MSDYFTSDFEKTISRKKLRKADTETQLEVMKTWFFQNFENPAERTPYESREGGYIWIWGGPHDAREELTDEFSGIVADDLIEEGRETKQKGRIWRARNRSRQLLI